MRAFDPAAVAEASRLLRFRVQVLLIVRASPFALQTSTDLTVLTLLLDDELSYV